MQRHSVKFGFVPKPLKIDTGNISIRSVPGIEAKITDVKRSEEVEGDWIYSPAQQSRDFVSGVVKSKPYPARIFGLPKTHILTHQKAEDDKHLTFHLWSLSFFLGLRLTDTEAGFLDATPLKTGKLVDFVPLGESLSASIELADQFWVDNRASTRQPLRFAAAVHALFLAQYPHALQSERFLYLYTALDACFAIVKEKREPKKHIAHGDRIEWLCECFGMETPTWATSSGSSRADVATMRNAAFHEALYMDEPLGFAIRGRISNHDLLKEMEALICRFLVAIIGASSAKYVRSRVNTRQRFDLKL